MIWRSVNIRIHQFHCLSLMLYLEIVRNESHVFVFDLRIVIIFHHCRLTGCSLGAYASLFLFVSRRELERIFNRSEIKWLTGVLFGNPRWIPFKGPLHMGVLVCLFSAIPLQSLLILSGSAWQCLCISVISLVKMT